MTKRIVFFLCCLTLVHPAFSQSGIGLPAIRNYKNTDFHAAIEIWDIHQDKKGLLYFANNEGLLSFDGAYWKTYPLPHKAAIKSLAIDDSGRIYVGGEDEIGYFFPNVQGVLTYHSLTALLPAIARQFADIWNIVILKDEVYFRTIESIFRLKNSRIQTFDAPGGWRMMTLANGRLYAEDKTKGLMVMDGDQWKEAAGPFDTAPLHITGVLEYKKDTLLVTTLKDGLYQLSGSSLIRKPAPVDPFLANDRVTGGQKTIDNRYALTTVSGGILIIDESGRLTDRFSGSEGLQNNRVLGLLQDRDGNFWLGLENGISFIQYNSAVTHIYPVRNSPILSNAACVSGQRLYIGTSNGLYSVALDPKLKDIVTGKGEFTEVANTRGQVWSVREMDGLLLMGHQDGAFVIKDHRAVPVMTKQGVWGFATGESAGIVAGTYTGLEGLRYDNGHLREGNKISDLYESLPLIAQLDSSAVWASHPYRGVFRIPLPAGHYVHYTTGNGLPSNLNNFVYLIRNRIVAATTRGVYEYNGATDRWVQSPFFQPIFGDTSVECLAEDRDGHIWFVSRQRVGVIESGGRGVRYFPELRGQTVKDHPFIYPYDDQNIFIGSNNGMLHINYSRYIQSDNGVTVVLGSVNAIAEKDSLLFGGYAVGGVSAADSTGSPSSGSQSPHMPNHWNSFRFEYSSPLYTQQDYAEFSYRLEGFDKEWSAWSSRTEKDYTNLPFGNYTFSVRARNNLGNVSLPVGYTFSVNPAWYETIWARLFYLLLAAGAIYWVRGRQRRRLAHHQKRHEEEQARLQYLHSLELDRKEKGLIALQNAKLEGELQFKNKELATVTMHLVERGGLLSNVKEELLAVIKKANVPNLAYDLRGVFKMISGTEKSDEDWSRFAIYFDQVHNNFLSILKTKYPQLSSADLKLCAYLRLNLSSKEIAQLLNISLKGVEVSRYRIRKKLNLPSEVNLYDFLTEATHTG